MKLTETWLRTWVNPALTLSQITEQLSLAGLETEIIESRVQKFQGIIVGKIEQVEKHPRADRLTVCRVDCGLEQIPQKNIICGASNVRPGLRVAVALPGATLPNGMVIEKRNLRGVDSEGMLCSLQELGLLSLFPKEAATQPGIWELSCNFTIGADLWNYLKLSQSIIDVQVPPNRGDCLSAMGIARELGSLNNFSLPHSILPTFNESLEDNFPITVHTPKACPYYSGRILRNLNSNAKVPYWILERLQCNGLRSVNAIVDVVNYIMLEWGAPLHAFDLSHLQQDITLRFAHPNESLELLNQRTIQLNERSLVIADNTGPQALAGILGGQKSAVSHTTTTIFLESACFNPEVIQRSAALYEITTDASYRFTRGVDVTICKQALSWATELLLKICGGQAGPVNELNHEEYQRKSQEILLRLPQISKVLGIKLPLSTIENFLNRLGILYTPVASEEVSEYSENSAPVLSLKPPHWRFDLIHEVDVIEEIARLHGYNQLPTQLPRFSVDFSKKTQNDKSILTRCRYFWMDQGYYETIHYSFTSSTIQQRLDPKNSALVITNPISNELNVLRTHLWPGLINTLSYNHRHQQTKCAFFEIGTVFLNTEQGILEIPHLAGIASGPVLQEQWGAVARPLDFFDIKQIVQNSLSILNPYTRCIYKTAEHPALHPGQCSQIYQDKEAIGWVGALHPKLYTHFGLTSPVYLFEIQLNTNARNSFSHFQPFSKFPSVRRDLAFWVSNKISFSSLEATIRKQAGDCLQDLRLFDIYQNPDRSAQRSLALGLIWQHVSRTLHDKEVDQWQNAVIQALRNEWNIQLRDQ